MVKRLFAVASGATMLGATAMGALAAANLDNYPDMFVTNGTFDGLFVVGESAASVDNLAMTDIASSMKTTKANAATTTSVEGDSWLVETSGNFLELGEPISNISSYIGSSELGALADGSISNAKGISNYEQFLYFNNNDATVTFQEDDSDHAGYFYKIANNDQFARYYVDFIETLKSDSTGTTFTLDDIEDKQITLMGKTFTITTATNGTNGVKLVLMGGSSTDTIAEGETKTYTVKGVEYEVTLLSVATESSTDKVQFSVNGETTNKMADGDTDVLDDGTNIGVTSITYQNYAGGIHSAKFFLGADKIELENNQAMKVNEETISEANVNIGATFTSGDVAIDDFAVNMTADDDLYIAVGDKLSTEAELDEPEVLFTQNWDITLAGVESTGEEKVDLTFAEGNDQADLTVTLADGLASIPLVYDNSSSAEQLGLGEDDDQSFRFVFEEALTDEDMFIVSSKDPTVAANDANSYLLQYKGSDDVAETTPKVRVKNLVTGETYERSISTASGSSTFDLKLGGVTFNFANVSSAASDDFMINLTDQYALTGVAAGVGNKGGTSTNGTTQRFRTGQNNMVTIVANGTDTVAYGGSPNSNPNSYGVTLVVDDGDKMDDSTDATGTPDSLLNVSIDGSTTDKYLTTSTGGLASALVSDPADSDIQYLGANYGGKLTITAPESGPSKYELSIPKEQAHVKMYITSGSTTTATSATGDLVAVTVVDATKLDSEVASVSAQNLVVVGGPCVNTVAAQLMGNPTDCTEGFTPGKARIKLFENSGKVAMLVAGYSGADTRLAGKVISHRYNDANFKGMEVEVEGTTYTDATIGVPTVAVTTSLADDAAADTTADTTTQ
ncbi:hypothetical protein HYT52_02305 [Candidatus Woesearchaeota archaeon]|nr:hypothetical protein [Candidatus Woesearchaeota archaeon]